MAGPSGLDAVELQHWLFCYGAGSMALAEELAEWTAWLANKSPLGSLLGDHGQPADHH